MNSQSNGFHWREFDAYLFDIDGTLLNTRDAVHYHAFHHALRTVLACEERIDNVPVHGSTDVRILRDTAKLAGIERAQFDENLNALCAEIAAEVERNAAELRPEVCPSIPRVLDYLHQAGKLIGVTTGNLESVAWAKLRAAGIPQYFSFGSFSGPHESRADIFRYGAEQARLTLGNQAGICFIGDTPSDVAAAREIGCPVIAVATGIYSREQLAELRPNLCLDCCDSLWP